MSELQEILEYAKSLNDTEPDKTAYWHYKKIISKIEELIDLKQK